MNLNSIKEILSTGTVLDNQINTMIESLDVQELGELSKKQTETLSNTLSNMLLAIQVSNLPAHLDNVKKAELLLEEIRSSET